MSTFSNSSACSKSELDIFYTLPTNTSILKSNISIFPTLNPLSGTEDTFTIEIPPTEEYTDLNDIFLEIDVSIPKIKELLSSVKPDCSPINNFAHSLFKNIELSIGVGLKKTLIETGNYYAYKAYLLNLLNYDDDIKSTSLQSGLWIKDEAGKFDDKSNTGFTGRREVFVQGKDSSKFIIPLRLDFLNSNRFLLSRYGLTFTFKTNDNKFCLFGTAFANYDVKIMKANILARRCLINSAVVSAHYNAIQISPAKYPVKQNKIFTAFISDKRLDFTPPKFLTTIPNKIVVGLVLDSAFSGDKHNPFNFQHFHVSKITLTIDSQEQYIQMNADNHDCSQAYHAMYQSLNLYNQGSNGLSQKDFLGGNCLFTFNLSPDKGCEEQFNHIRTGNVVLKFEFAKATEFQLRMVLFMEFDNQINLDNKDNVYWDYLLN
jgi:hypothetical protein